MTAPAANTNTSSGRPCVGIFAGASTPNDPAIIEAATQLGTLLGKAGYNIAYGAGTQGVMGAVAKAAQAAGAEVTAVVLKKYDYEEQLPGARLVFVETEQERFKELTTRNSPVACFAMPGGAGTLREVMQGLELAVYEGGPKVVLVQVGTYMDGLKASFNASVDAGLIKSQHADKLQLWKVADGLAAVLPATAPAAPATASKFAKKP
ncbi:MAG: LOG family protein [Micavibrio sp.]|nr:LOG family protein [Micavibrio sp.]